MSFPTELRRIRESRGLSQSALGRKAGFDHSYISRLESGKREPSRMAVEAVLKAVGASESEKGTLAHSAGYVSEKLPVLAALARLLDAADDETLSEMLWDVVAMAERRRLAEDRLARLQADTLALRAEVDAYRRDAVSAKARRLAGRM